MQLPLQLLEVGHSRQTSSKQFSLEELKGDLTA